MVCQLVRGAAKCMNIDAGSKVKLLWQFPDELSATATELTNPVAGRLVLANQRGNGIEVGERDVQNFSLIRTSERALVRDVAAVVLSSYGLNGSIERLAGEKDDNFRLTTTNDERYLLKVAHVHEDLSVLELQSAVLEHLHNTVPHIALQRVIRSSSGCSDVLVEQGPLLGRFLRVTSYLEGTQLHSVTSTSLLRREIGVVAATMDLALRDFDHPGAHRKLLWDLQNLGDLRTLINELVNTDDAKWLGDLLDRIDSDVSSRRSALRSQIVHNDLSRDNVLVTSDGSSLSGVIDFGDLVYTQLVNDVAIAATNQLSDDLDPTPHAIDVVAGFHSVMPLTDFEIGLLPSLVLARTVMWITIPQWRALRFPENRDYVLRNAARARSLLVRLLVIPPELFRDNILRACRVEENRG